MVFDADQIEMGVGIAAVHVDRLVFANQADAWRIVFDLAQVRFDRAGFGDRDEVGRAAEFAFGLVVRGRDFGKVQRLVCRISATGSR